MVTLTLEWPEKRELKLYPIFGFVSAVMIAKFSVTFAAYTGRMISNLTHPELSPKLDTVEDLVTAGLVYITEADSAGQEPIQ